MDTLRMLLVLTAVAACAALAPRVAGADPLPLIVFTEPGFPATDVPRLADPPPGAVAADSSDALVRALGGRGVLVWRHGSAFPQDAWTALRQFLARGGSLLYIGGEPFTRPVTGPSGARIVQPRTVSYLKALRLNQCYRVAVPRGQLASAPSAAAPLTSRALGESAWASVLEPRLTDTRDFDNEEGSPGVREGIVRPLVFVRMPGEDARFPAATAAFVIDRIQNEFAGGRWVFWLVSDAPTDAERALLVREATRPAFDFRADPSLGSFHPGEQPALNLRLLRPGATDSVTVPVTISVSGPGGRPASQQASLHADTLGEARVPLQVGTAPGLYRVTATTTTFGAATTGFWIFDPALFASGDALTFDDYTMRRNGRAEPVVGTTMMSPTVHRNFLFEPDAASWDDTFAELASLHINMVRTGTWSGWKRIASKDGEVDEGFLRALEAYYLTARAHGIPVVFNVFAFAPEAFGGANPYLDPRAVAAQKKYVGAIASRFARAREFMWDFINEPSFSPAHLWTTRPNGDPFERDAFLAWLQKRYAAAAEPGESWQDVVRARWRLLPSDPIGLPVEDDFADRHTIGSTRPYRVVDFTLFEQDAFDGWMKEMTSAVRAAGSQGAVTVGQDEGGLGTRPMPLFHHADETFTSMHTWWNNDAQLWDSVLAKATATPLLVSETGIMQRELLSGDAIRTPEGSAQLLSRKIGYAFAAGAFGVIQWCYDVNPYMPIDNEAAIGLRRADGSYKPEHRVLREVAAFVARHRDAFDASAPEVALIVPVSDLFSPRDTATFATRTAVDVLAARLAIPVRTVAEYRAQADLGQPKAIVLPSPRGVAPETWDAISAAVARGAHLIASGWFETDDVGNPARRLGVDRRSLSLVELASGASRAPATAIRFSGTVSESWFGAAGDAAPVATASGAGTIHHHPLPIELGDAAEVVEMFYRDALRSAGVSRPPEIDGAVPQGCTLRLLSGGGSIVAVFVNETPVPQTVTLKAGGRTIQVTAPPKMSEFAAIDRTTGTMETVPSRN